MPDITMCTNRACPSFSKCYRAQAHPNGHRQSYAFFEPDESGRCERYECAHASVMPTFDQDAASGLSAAEVKKRWPRFMGSCPECGDSVILYHSFAHYLYGDW